MTTTTVLPNDDAVLGNVRKLIGTIPSDVLDLGGGTGVYAVPLAKDGHRVQVVDFSNDALATLARRAHSEGVGDLVRGHVADLDGLADAVPNASVDVVLCHRVLEFVESPEKTVAAAAAALRPGGVVSVVAANRPGAALSRAIAGRFDEAAAALDGLGSAQSGRRFDTDEIGRLLDEAGLAVERVCGVGLIGELNPSSAGAAQVRALAERMSTDPVLAQVAPLVHVLARRQSDGS